MIKVNLLRDRSVISGATDDSGLDLGISETNPKEVLVKVVCICGFTVGLMVWESTQIDALNAKKGKYKKEIQVLTAKKTKMESEASKSIEHQKEIEKIKNKVGTLRSLAKLRLREVRALDMIQNLINEKVWLEGLEFGEKDITIKGSAINEIVINQFIGAIEASGEFSNVILLKSTMRKGKNDETLRDFLINGNLEGDS